jgi:hypothetical protein
MAEYLILIYEDEAAMADVGEEAFEQMMKGHNEFGHNNEKVLRGGNALQPPSTATSIRTDSSGRFVVSDGPFVETKEGIGGYYLVEAANLDEAIALAKQVPAPAGVEIRPVRVFD